MPTPNAYLFSGKSHTIYCYEYSDVDFWAAEKGYARVYIDGMDLSKPISIELPEDMRLEIGTSFTVTSATFPENASQGVVWQSSNPSVVSVENGVLTAKAVGEATITASCDGASDQMNVVVYTPVGPLNYPKRSCGSSARRPRSWTSAICGPRTRRLPLHGKAPIPPC